MKATVLKHYGKILLTIILLGAGAYFHVDVTKFLPAVAGMFESAPAVSNTPDAGQ